MKLILAIIAVIAVSAIYAPRTPEWAIALSLLYGIGAGYAAYMVVRHSEPNSRTEIVNRAESLMRDFIDRPSESRWESSWNYICMHDISMKEVNPGLFKQYIDISTNQTVKWDAP